MALMVLVMATTMLLVMEKVERMPESEETRRMRAEREAGY